MVAVLLMFVSVVVAASAVPTLNSAANERIIGGFVAPEGAFPYQVYIAESSIPFGCGGSIIDSTTILTGAHCVRRISIDRISIWVGKSKLSSGGVEHAVSDVIIHEDFINYEYAHDIALVKLKIPITFSDKVQPIELETEDVGAGVNAVVSGWGRISSTPWEVYPNDLHYLNTTTVTNAECLSSHQNKVPVKDFHICTLTRAGEGVCYGDNGSALVANNRQIGISLWGGPCATGKADLFTRVSYYKDWIAKNRV